MRPTEKAPGLAYFGASRPGLYSIPSQFRGRGSWMREHVCGPSTSPKRKSQESRPSHDAVCAIAQEVSVFWYLSDTKRRERLSIQCSYLVHHVMQCNVATISSPCLRSIRMLQTQRNLNSAKQNSHRARLDCTGRGHLVPELLLVFSDGAVPPGDRLVLAHHDVLGNLVEQSIKCQ